MTTHETPGALYTPRTLGRVFVAILGVGALLVAASSFEPGESEALPAIAPSSTAAPQATPDPTEKSLGRYQGVDHAVHIVATPEGPRYTITDAAGNILETRLHDHEVYSALEAHGIEVGQPVDNSPALMIAEDRFEGVLD
jgi:hypothetical protein